MKWADVSITDVLTWTSSNTSEYIKNIIQEDNTKEIIGLSCGTANGNCEMLLKAAATGAEEFGIGTE